MALSPPEKAVVLKESLEDWQGVGSGGFGRVYKARHRDWGFDVAVKILKDTSHFTFNEAKFMDLASCEFVLRMYGVTVDPSGERGLVTEYMRRGSIASLQKELHGPLPWPLAFRLAHQTALAMNFLHQKNIVHLDLTPHNVLLSDELNIRLADFGLSTETTSAEGACRHSTTERHGTYKYMPPEAFDISYEPVRAYDIYSFGILLWSIFSGKEPYPMANYARVELRIPLGDRPSCADLLRLKVKGIKDVVDLMEKCWVEDPRERPHFKEIIKETETLFSRHSSEILRAVHGVLTKLDASSQTQKPSNEHHGAQLKEAVNSESVMEVEKVTSHGASRKTKTREENAILPVPGSSLFRLLWRWLLKPLPVNGQVMLFRTPWKRTKTTTKVHVYLLPRNVPLDQVKERQEMTEYIDAPPHCQLVVGQNYSVVCPSAEIIQPARALFDMDYGPNFSPSFELLLPPESSTVSITVREEGSSEEIVVWRHQLDLSEPLRSRDTSTRPQRDHKTLLESVRLPFVYSVSDPVLNQLLDLLLQERVMTSEEMDRIRAMRGADKARCLVDTVIKKGSGAASVLIREYYQLDPHSELCDRLWPDL